MNSPTKRLSLNRAQLEGWTIAARSRSRQGTLPTYIPQLAAADPGALAVRVLGVDGRFYDGGDRDRVFPLMSVVKPFLLLRLLVELGSDRVFARLGMEPSDRPFNSLEQLQIDGGRPRNPMINSGAIALAGLLTGEDGATRCRLLCDWLNGAAGCNLQLDGELLASVRSVPNSRNQAIAAELARAGYVEDATLTLDTYNHICCLSGTVADLAQLGLLLLEPPEPAWTEGCRQVKALMMTCGLYEASGSFAVRVGVPTKSGVSGAVLSVVPGWGAIACYSPPLDAAGNSVAGLFLIEEMA
ncbi:glutaminase, partial [Lyngbya sp. CCY1209]|uniref:glutaminase n=1 Tax=Lyngbya sp. CCY1209 TaxID=2886103 RepID=UPI002D21359E